MISCIRPQTKYNFIKYYSNLTFFFLPTYCHYIIPQVIYVVTFILWTVSYPLQWGLVLFVSLFFVLNRIKMSIFKSRFVLKGISKWIGTEFQISFSAFYIKSPSRLKLLLYISLIQHVVMFFQIPNYLFCFSW